MDKVNIWEQEIDLLKELLKDTELSETVKWGTPVFTYNGKNVLGIAGFKNHLALWFYNGFFLKDEGKVLINAQDGKTKALRQWRFSKNDSFDKELILNYVKEAIENEKAGKVWKPEKSEALEMPAIMVEAFKLDKSLQSLFFKLPPYKQKDFIEYIESAKKTETQTARIEKIKPIILAGKGLNDRYK